MVITAKKAVYLKQKLLAVAEFERLAAEKHRNSAICLLHELVVCDAARALALSA